jgi:hypothetical protein
VGAASAFPLSAPATSSRFPRRGTEFSRGSAMSRRWSRFASLLNWIANRSTTLNAAPTIPIGNREGTSNPRMTLPADVREYPDAIAQALSQLRLVGVNGPYSVLLGADAYTALAETSDNGYPVLEHIKKLVEDEIIWTPAIAGAFVLTTRGGDFDLHIGQDVSIGYLSHTESSVRLYLQETLTFLLLTSEAAVALAPTDKKKT